MSATIPLSPAALSAAGGLTAGVSEVSFYDQLFAGTGRWALMTLGANNEGTPNFGSSVGDSTRCRRATTPYRVMLKEMAKNKYIAYEIASSALTGGTQSLSLYSIMEPMKETLWFRPEWTYRNAADTADIAAQYPQTPAAFKYFKVDLSGLSTAVNRIGMCVGYTSTSCGLVIVSITDKVSGTTMVPNLLRTATQAVAYGMMDAADLVSNGGSIPDAAYVASTNIVDTARGGYRSNEVPFADSRGLTGSGQYIVRLDLTTVHGSGAVATIDRAYIPKLLYGYDGLSHLDAGADLYRTDWISGANDGSANETQVLQAHKNGTASADQFLGGGHGGEVDTSAVWTIDGRVNEGWAKTISRARASGTATIVLDRTVDWKIGDPLTVTGLNGGLLGSYCQELNATITGISTTTLPNDTITYHNTTYVGGALGDEATTADTAGIIFNNTLFFGSEVKLTQVSTLTHSIDGLLANKTNTYTGSGAKLAVRSATTLAVDCYINIGSYDLLATIWSASRSTYGPMVGGLKRFRMIDTSTSAVPNARDDSEIMSDRDGLGYIAWEAEGGTGTAIVIRSQPPPGAKQFLQDRAATGGVKVNKIYRRINYASATVFKAGTVFRGEYDRYDTVRRGYSHALLQPV